MIEVQFLYWSPKTSRLLLDLVDSLEDAGFKVFSAHNADRAIEILSEHEEIRLLVTDVDMPGSMDGIKLAAHVRERWPPVKIIVVSGQRKVSADQVPHGSRFFGKPYDPNRLIGSMDEMLGLQ